MSWILFGAFLTVVFLVVARRGTVTNRVIGNGLVVAALIYVGFAVFGEASSGWLVIEMIGVVVYATFAWLGVNRSGIWLGIWDCINMVPAVSSLHSGTSCCVSVSIQRLFSDWLSA